MRRLRFNVSYEGTDFHGWQVQPGLATIQGTLEEVIGGIEGGPVHVSASGRTDAGVHAYAQVAAVVLQNPIPPENFRRAVNRLLPHSIRVFDVSETDVAFHPRFQARRKTYEYRIFRDEICPPFLHRYVYHLPYPLEEETMIACAPLLEGTHDFTAFAARDESDEEGVSKTRTIFESGMERTGALLVYRVRGSGFLKHMVRNIVGVLLQAGRGNLRQQHILSRLIPGCGIPAGPTAPASGLFLISVDFE